MASVLTNYFGNKILTAYLVKNGAWIGLHSGDPGVTGSFLFEVIGGGYIRQKAIFTTPAGKTVSNSGKLVFPALPTVVITYISLNDAQVTGNMLASIEVSPISIPADSHFVIAAHDLALTI